jgi:hypothetical protein
MKEICIKRCAVIISTIAIWMGSSLKAFSDCAIEDPGTPEDIATTKVQPDEDRVTYKLLGKWSGREIWIRSVSVPAAHTGYFIGVNAKIVSAGRTVYSQLICSEGTDQVPLFSVEGNKVVLTLKQEVLPGVILSLDKREFNINHKTLAITPGKTSWMDNQERWKKNLERSLKDEDLMKLRDAMELVILADNAQRYPSSEHITAVQKRVYERARDVANSKRKKGQSESAANELYHFLATNCSARKLSGFACVPEDLDVSMIESIQVMNDIGFLLGQGKHLKEAEIILTEVVRREPKRKIAYKNLAEVQEKMGKTQSAEQNRQLFKSLD